MNDRARLRYERAVRVQTFGEKNAADFAPGSVATTLFGENSALVRDVEKASATQLRGADTGKEILLDALRLDLRAIARTARGIAVPERGFSDSYRMPETNSEAELLTTGDAFLAALATPGAAQKFIEREMPADFIADLTADLAAVRNYKGEKEEKREDSVQATAAIARLVKRSTEIVAELRPIMSNKYSRSNPDKLRAWMSASHLERMPERQKPDGGTTPPPASGGATPPPTGGTTPPPAPGSGQ